MKKKYFVLINIILLNIVIMSACNNDETYVLELKTKPETETNVALNEEVHTIDDNWVKTQHESLSGIDHVTMEIEDKSVTSTGLKANFKNLSNKQIIFVENYTLEKNANNKWYEIPLLEDNYKFSRGRNDLKYKQERNWEANWEMAYGQLEPGEYRIIKDIIDYWGKGCFNKEYLIAEFEVD